MAAADHAEAAHMSISQTNPTGQRELETNPVASGSPSIQQRRGTARAEPSRVKPNEDRLADGLGWFSIGLGLVELLAPRAIGRAAGIACNPGLVQVMGLREIATGIGLLTQARRSEWLWARVAGDGLDAAALAVAAVRPDARRGRALAAGVAVAGIAALDVYASRTHGRREPEGQADARSRPIRVQHTISVNRPVAECYRYWRDYENLPYFMKHLESVRGIDERRSHWIATGPLNTRIEWDSEIIAEETNRFIAWRTLPGADVAQSGIVRFEEGPAGRGTIVRVEMVYGMPGGPAGAAVARLFGMAPEQIVKEDARRFKQILETGEVPTTIGQPAGQRSAVARLLVKKGLPG
jgi:uncharacterized membrane protein